MMLKNSFSYGEALACHRCRTFTTVRCATSAAEHRMYGHQREHAPRAPDNGIASTSTPQTQSHGLLRTAGRYGSKSPVGSAPIEKLLPLIVYLEDDVQEVTYRAKVTYMRFFAEGDGVVLRSLGRQGAAAVIRYILAVREAGAAAADLRDVRVQVLPQRAIPHFGTPLMMIVRPVQGRTELPQEDMLKHRPLVVSARTDSGRLATLLQAKLNAMQAGQFVRIDMVGTDALYRGLMALHKVYENVRFPKLQFFIVPELVSMPVRSRPTQQQQEQDEALAGQQVAAKEAPQHLQVVRLYVGRSRALLATEDGTEGRSGRSAVSAAGEEQPGTQGGKVLVSEAELQELKDALGSMLEQQQMLTQLLAEQGAAAAAGLARQQA